MERAKVTKHKATIVPWECRHCGAIWYGFTGHQTVIPDDMELCTRCWSALDNYLYKHYQEIYLQTEKDCTILHELARKWITDKNNKPSLRLAEKRFSSSVPQWMRSAVNTGMVKTNSNTVYIVYSEGQNVIRVETVDA